MIMSGVGAWSAIKLASAAGCVWGAWGVYQTMPLPATRSKMLKCFKAADICVEREGKEKPVKKYPIVNKVSISGETMYAIFTIPLGLDPKEVHKKSWVFRQTFGENIELEGNSRMFTLAVHGDNVKQFDYDYEEMKKVAGDHKLPVVCGKGRYGWVAYDMVTQPHVLVTGETGSGKSTMLRQMLTFWMQHMSPEKLQLYLADLKRTEFHIFKHTPHIVKNVLRKREVLAMLDDIHDILEERGDLLNEHGEAHIDDLKEDIRPPYIVVCIDEFALLQDEDESMKIIEEISTIGRSMGVFLVLSCQRADRNIMDGFLKNNLTVRMAFRTADEINSRITLGQEGKGTGDAAYIKQSETGKMILKLDGFKAVQAPYLDMNKAKAILSQWMPKESVSTDSGDVVPITARRKQKKLAVLDDDAEG